MSEVTELVVVSKPGEPKLQIHRSALDEHKRLGWIQVESEPEKPKDDEAKGKTAAKKDGK